MTITYRTMLITSMVAAIGMNTAEFAWAVETATEIVQMTRVESTANQSPSSEAPLRATVRRGLSGSVRFTHVSSGLEVRANQSVDGPVLVRLELMGSKGDVDDANTVYEYVLRFFGMQAGTFDLSQLLTIDGKSQVHSDRSIEPLWVKVVSELPLSRALICMKLLIPD